MQFLAPKLEFTDLSLRWIPISRLAWSLYKCAALWRTVYGPSATKKSLRNVREMKGMFPWFWVSISFWRAVSGPSATETPLGTIRDEKGISSWFRVSISSRYDLSCRKRLKANSFLPSTRHLLKEMWQSLT